MSASHLSAQFATHFTVARARGNFVHLDAGRAAATQELGPYAEPHKGSVVLDDTKPMEVALQLTPTSARIQSLSPLLT
jgi:hypothetical protein